MLFGSLFDLVSVIIFSPRLFASRLVSSVVLFTLFLLVLSEEMLHLSVSARFSAQWIPQQLPSWRAGVAEVGFPPSCFVQSTAAQNNRTRQGVPADGFALPEFSVTNPVLLYLLCRWTHTLKDHQRQCAKSILRHLIGLIPLTALQWHFTEQDAPEHAFPCTTSEDSVAIDVSAQDCGIVQLCTASRALASAFKAHGHKLDTTWNNAPAEQRVKLWRLALWLTGGSGKRTCLAAHSLFSGLSWLLEHSSLWEQASSDAMFRDPVPQG
jgi:hypothetical protein